MKNVTVYEVGPRDGLQNESTVVPPESKIQFIQLLAQSGLSRIEATSFVRPGVIPQMSDATQVYRSVSSIEKVRMIALVPNAKGMEQALDSGVQEVAIFTAASESFTKRNINCSIEESIGRFTEVMRMASSHRIPVRAYISTVVQCPYEGAIAPEKVATLSDRLLQMGVYQISLGETIGVAVPEDVSRLLESVLKKTPVDTIACHFHDTRGTALANVFKSLEFGVRNFDSSAGGLGGCPYAPGAAGNLATEDLLYALERSGYNTGVDIEKIADASAFMRDIIQKEPTSKAFAAVLSNRVREMKAGVS